MQKHILYHQDRNILYNEGVKGNQSNNKSLLTHNLVHGDKIVVHLKQSSSHNF